MRNEPQLRFNRFTEPYSEFTLGDIATFFKGKGISKSDIHENGVIECIRYGELYTRYGENITKIFSKTNASDLVFSEKYDVITPSSGETAIDLATASCVSKDGVALGGDINIIRTKQHGLYLSYYLNSNKKYDFAKLGQGNSVVHIYNSHLKELKIKLPNFDEQHKVASFISTLDHNIDLLDSKLENLKLFKKGLLDKYIYGTAFKKVKLDSVVSCLDNQRVPLNNSEREKMRGDIPYYGANGLLDYVNDFIFDGEYVLLAEDGGHFNEFSKKEIAQRLTGKSWVNNHAHILKANSNIYNDFLYYSLVHKDIRKYLNGTSRAKLNKSDLLKIEIGLPSLERQNYICRMLNSISKKIDNNNVKIETLKQFNSLPKYTIEYNVYIVKKEELNNAR